MGTMGLISSASWVFIQQFIQAQIKENKKQLRITGRSLCWEFTGHRWIPRTED